MVTVRTLVDTLISMLESELIEPDRPVAMMVNASREAVEIMYVAQIASSEGGAADIKTGELTPPMCVLISTEAFLSVQRLRSERN